MTTWEWQNVLPYFMKSEKIDDSSILNSPDRKNHGTSGYCTLEKEERNNGDDILKSLKSLGHNIRNDPVDDVGYSKPLLYVSEGKRISSASAYLTPIKDRTNLHVLKNSFVTKINAVGVDFINGDGNSVTVNTRKEVIVSAGAFNSPKLLMLSGIGSKEQLLSHKINVISDLPVGQNLQDHVGVVLPYAMEKIEKKPVNPYKMPTESLIGYTALDKCQNYPDYESYLYSGSGDIILYFCSFAYSWGYDICDNSYLQLSARRGLFSEIVQLLPKSRGEVKLRTSNPMDPPVITTGYLSNEHDLEELIKYIKDFIPLINTTYFKKIGAEFIDPTLVRRSDFEFESSDFEGSDEYWKFYASCMFSGMNHFSGTCAMGNVVDSKLRVHGVQHLRVADASIMPLITRGDTNGPVTMIGEKAADFIKKDYHC